MQTAARKLLWTKLPVLHQISLVSVSTLAKLVSRIGTFLVIAPLIGPENQGILVKSGVWAAIVALIMAYGFQVSVLRDVAVDRAHARQVVLAKLRAMLALTPLVSGIAIVPGLLLFDADQRLVFALILIATAFSVLTDFVASSLRALGLFPREAIITCVGAVVQVVIVVAAGLATRAVVPVAWALLLTGVFTAAISLIGLLRTLPGPPAGRRDQDGIAATLRSNVAYFFDATLAVGVNQIDTLILSLLVGAYELGIYSPGARLVQMTTIAIWMATNVMVPRLVNLREGDRFQAERGRLLLGLCGLAVLSAGGLLFVGPIFTDGVLGEAFSPLNQLWPAFAALAICRYIEGYFGILLVVENHVPVRAWGQFYTIIAVPLLTVPSLTAFGLNGVVLVLCGVTLARSAWYARALSMLDAKGVVTGESQ